MITPAGRIAAQLRRDGANVVVRTEDVTRLRPGTVGYGYNFDHVIVGLAPLRGVSSAYMYGALAAVNLFGDRCLTYAQDLDGRRTENDLRALARDPKALVDPFFLYKRGWHAARSPEIFPRLVETVRMLADEERRPHSFDLDDLSDLRLLAHDPRCVTIR
jgi:hypothetical protein